MKKVKTDESSTREEMRPEYDFSSMKGGVRGKYYKAYREGHKVIIHEDDGSDSVQYFKLEDGAVMLEPDVREYFPTSQAVNEALRALIRIIPSKRDVADHRK
ncbi:MAG TPA: hypothetical protein PK847_09600 [Candidatus Sumerlaeota bacterium]|nr:MAG: hypothetical protein BWZ08_01632 [candidate division BRC1 bacterium ADurb.BinA292]HOE96824.1 hypothetical protein [Candidatus Sumerlaeota bacterium]HOR28285.1 hypothetical protein [Candidatus Sumerlaeota bacterium]